MKKKMHADLSHHFETMKNRCFMPMNVPSTLLGQKWDLPNSSDEIHEDSESKNV
jgi:hypothetical protein